MVERAKFTEKIKHYATWVEYIAHIIRLGADFLRSIPSIEKWKKGEADN